MVLVERRFAAASVGAVLSIGALARKGEVQRRQRNGNDVP